jgi:predicted nucleic acid-binding Zn ribbon protein
VALPLDRIRDELAPQTVLAEAQRVWPQAVGETIAAEARPTSERGGTLTVSCSASVWAQELDLMAPSILARLNSCLRDSEITRLRCVAVPVRDDF